MNYCTNCGSKLKENANYCEECGSKVERPVPNNQSQVSAAPTSLPQTKSNNKTLFIVLGIVGAIIIMILLMSAVFVASLLNFTKVIDEKQQEIAKNNVGTLILDEVSIEYPKYKWTELEKLNSENIRAIINNSSTISLSKENSTVSLKEQIEMMEKAYQSLGYEKFAENEEVYINGNTWTKMTYESQANKLINITLMYMDEDEVYLLTFQSPSNNYYIDEQEFKEIYMTLKVQ